MGWLDRYIRYARENKLGLGNNSLAGFLAINPGSLSLYKLLGWSEAVNRTFPHISAKIEPSDNVKPSLQLMAEYADIIVVSQTPYDDLADYWEANGLTEYIRLIAGQEMGTKAKHIEVIKIEVGY